MRALLFIIIIFLSACSPSQRSQVKENFTPSFNPTNTYSVHTLPSHIHKVVCLPVYSTELEWTTLDPIDESFLSELIQTQLFEVVSIKRNDLMEWFGTSQFSSNGTFPPNFLEVIKKHTRVDAIMLIDLTHFRPYKPISIGIRAKLISLETNTLTWAFDCVFDSGDPRVAIGAKRYQQRFLSQSYPLHEPISVLQSPKNFSRYVAFTCFQNLLRIQPINKP